MTYPISKEQYEKSGEQAKAEAVKERYDNMNGADIYATSRDHNLRELEIKFILDNLGDCDNKYLLDLGCGNGYTDIKIAETKLVHILGIDFSKTMIEGARDQQKKTQLIGTIHFMEDDVVSYIKTLTPNFFDYILTERFLLNLPTKERQFEMIREIWRVLKPHGKYIMIEGTQQGLQRLNDLRTKCGLTPIPDRAEDNISSLKFNETHLEEYLHSLKFEIMKKQYFGTYYLISRVFHPMMISPQEPKFDSLINSLARRIAEHEPDFHQIGHILGYVLQK